MLQRSTVGDMQNLDPSPTVCPPECLHFLWSTVAVGKSPHLVLQGAWSRAAGSLRACPLLRDGHGFFLRKGETDPGSSSQ